MTTETPTRVVLYSYASGRPKPAAEFRLSSDSGVSLTVIDPAQGTLAEEYYERGVPYDAERRLVTRSEPATFMRALVQPQQSTYSRFVDESSESAESESAESSGAADLQRARAIAERVLDETVRPANSDVIIVEEHTRETAESWVFIYNTRAFIERGSFEDMLVGNAPLFVDKATGETRFGRTDISVEEQL